MKSLLFILCLFTGFALEVHADVVPNGLFSDHAVLQRNVEVPVWGTATDGEKVTVEFAGQKVNTTAAGGKWMIKLRPLKAGGPYTMLIKGNNSLILSDILVGEVWVCSGQSNMAMQLGPHRGLRPVENWEKERDEASGYPQIREFHVPYNPSGVPVSSVSSKWVVCASDTVVDFSAVGYFFAKELHKKLKVPVGMLFSAVGGTPAEFWTSYAALLSNPEQAKWARAYDRALKQFPEDLENYKRDEVTIQAKYRADTILARKENKPLPRKPELPKDPAKVGWAGGLYNGMIVPLQPYAIKGAIWYQGEANNSNAYSYPSLLTTMITDWRKAWGMGDFPFLFVQIAPFKGMSPEIREAQLLAWQRTPNTSMVVITDCGEAEDIHPIKKAPVGGRLSLAARSLAYGEKLEYSGPVYTAMTVEGTVAVLSFSHQKKLVAKGGPLKGFMMAGADKVFVPATAVISGKTIRVSSSSITQPVAVRYGWDNVPDVNLYNENDLPASPFRTDVKL